MNSSKLENPIVKILSRLYHTKILIFSLQKNLLKKLQYYNQYQLRLTI